MSARQKGFGLVELMVAMVIGLTILAGVYAIFISSHRTEMVNQAVSSIQDSARYLDTRLSERVRMAGAGGCGALNGKAIHVDARSYAGTLASFTAPVDGMNNVTASNVYGARVGTDVLTLSEMDPGVAALDPKSNPGAANIKLIGGQGWKQGEDVLITDCSHGDIFAITNNPMTNPSTGVTTLAHGTNANLTSKLAYAYSTDATTLARFLHVTYFVKAMPGQTAPDGQPEYALYEKVNARAAVPIVRHVSNFQVEYGLDTTPNDGVENVGAYVTADHVTDWSLVRSVRLTAVIRSANPYLSANAEAYPLGLDTADRRFKFLVSDVVAIRNSNP